LGPDDIPLRRHWPRDRRPTISEQNWNAIDWDWMLRRDCDLVADAMFKLAEAMND
jgi:hypothetical protein